MSKSPDAPMLGGCCICLDERGWAENPLVYCDGQGCSIAVHQACYGIVSVPSGPWYCRCCEVFGRAVQLPCKLCPYVGGGLKKIDQDNQWAHVVCGLYIPEVEFGNVSSMEPILIKKLPDDRFNKICYICDDNNRKEKNIGACMDCAKPGCKLSFHVTCAQMSGLLCEIAGASNTTKYCGFCKHHEYKYKKINSFKNLACAKVYKLYSDKHNLSAESNIKADNNVTFSIVTSVMTTSNIKPEQVIVEKNTDELTINNVTLAHTCNENNNIEHKIIDVVSNVCSSASLASLANVASFALEKETLHFTKGNSLNISSMQNDDIKKKKRKKSLKASKSEDIKTTKLDKVKKFKGNILDNITQEENTFSSLSDLEALGYAFAPKHSVVSLSEFGDSSLEPSHPSDIGETKPNLLSISHNVDGLTAIKQLTEKQEADLFHFFQEQGTSNNISQLLQMLHTLKEENKQMISAIEKMTHRRDQLLAIKARLSVPLHTKFPRLCTKSSDGAVADSKQFASCNEQQINSYPYFVCKN